MEEKKNVNRIYFTIGCKVQNGEKIAKIKLTSEPINKQNLKYGLEGNSSIYSFNELRKKIIEMPVTEKYALCFFIINEETNEKEKVCIKDILSKCPDNLPENKIQDKPGYFIDISEQMEKIGL